MSEIPDGIDEPTARTIIAWQIANMAYSKLSRSQDPTVSRNPEELIDDLTKYFRKAHNQLFNPPEGA